MHSYEDIFRDKKRALVVTAHPDDADVFFGGTISRLCKDKKEVFVLVMTNGARGSREHTISEEELAQARIKEQKLALKAYGVPEENFATLNYKDGEAESNLELIGQIAYHIRKFKPDIVLTHNPNYFFSKSFSNDHYHINHRDHRVCGTSTLDAVYPFCRDRSFFPEHSKEGVEPHIITEILFTADEVNTEIDVSAVIDKKKKGMLAHKSQFDENTVEKIVEYFKKGDKDLEKGFYIKLQ